MKHILFLFLVFALSACDRVEDHYRIKSVSIKVGTVSTGPNAQCVNIGNESDSSHADVVGVQIEFIREYYATENSNSQGVMYSPRGWEGSAEKITKLSVRSESEVLNNKLYGDSTITGVNKGKANWGNCQEGENCDCRNALSIKSLDSLVRLFNVQHTTPKSIFRGEKYDQTPFIFFIHRKEVEALNGKALTIKVKLSNGKMITGVSNKLDLK